MRKNKRILHKGGELLDRVGRQWEVFDIDGTREAARQRALPKMEDLPSAHRRLDEVCAAGYTGRKRGEVVLTRTVISQAHTTQLDFIQPVDKKRMAE
jgi:hypothetical protein